MRGAWQSPGSDLVTEVIKDCRQGSSSQAAPQGPKDPHEYHTLLWDQPFPRTARLAAHRDEQGWLPTGMSRTQKGKEVSLSPEKSSLYNTHCPVRVVPNCNQVLCGVAGGADQTGSQTLLVFLLAAVSRAKKTVT